MWPSCWESGCCSSIPQHQACTTTPVPPPTTHTHVPSQRGSSNSCLSLSPLPLYACTCYQGGFRSLQVTLSPCSSLAPRTRRAGTSLLAASAPQLWGAATQQSSGQGGRGWRELLAPCPGCPGTVWHGTVGLQVPAFSASASPCCKARWDLPLSCVQPWPAPGAGAAGPVGLGVGCAGHELGRMEPGGPPTGAWGNVGCLEGGCGGTASHKGGGEGASLFKSLPRGALCA